MLSPFLLRLDFAIQLLIWMSSKN